MTFNHTPNEYNSKMYITRKSSCLRRKKCFFSCSCMKIINNVSPTGGIARDRIVIRYLVLSLHEHTSISRMFPFSIFIRSFRFFFDFRNAVHVVSDNYQRKELHMNHCFRLKFVVVAEAVKISNPENYNEDFIQFYSSMCKMH